MDKPEHVGDSERLAARVARRRTERGLSRPELARLAGICHHHLWRIEQGLYRPSRRVALALASALDVPVQELLGEVKMEHLQQPGSVPAGFAQRLRDRRIALGLTCRALAQRAGVNNGYISQLEHGVSK